MSLSDKYSVMIITTCEKYNYKFVTEHMNKRKIMRQS